MGNLIVKARCKIHQQKNHTGNLAGINKSERERWDNKWKPDERSSLGLGARESMENRYEGSPEEIIW